jgi:hypothetical protein
VGLGADWLPSGSTSLLAELKVAERTLARQGHPLAPRQLVEMVTSTAAQIAGLGGQLGSLEQGRPADLLVLERRRQDPYESVVAADPSWVQLVMVDGDLACGRADWLGDLVDPADRDRLEPVVAWGTPVIGECLSRCCPGTTLSCFWTSSRPSWKPKELTATSFWSAGPPWLSRTAGGEPPATCMRSSSPSK